MGNLSMWDGWCSNRCRLFNFYPLLCNFKPFAMTVTWKEVSEWVMIVLPCLILKMRLCSMGQLPEWLIKSENWDLLCLVPDILISHSVVYGFLSCLYVQKRSPLVCLSECQSVEIHSEAISKCFETYCLSYWPVFFRQPLSLRWFSAFENVSFSDKSFISHTLWFVWFVNPFQSKFLLIISSNLWLLWHHYHNAKALNKTFLASDETSKVQ